MATKTIVRNIVLEIDARTIGQVYDILRQHGRDESVSRGGRLGYEVHISAIPAPALDLLKLHLDSSTGGYLQSDWT